MDNVLRCLVAGGFLQIARLQPAATVGGRSQYKTLVGGHLASIHPTSCLFGKKPQPPFVIFNEIVYTKRQYLRGISIVDSTWLPELAPKWFKRLSGDDSKVELHEGATSSSSDVEPSSE